MNSPNKEIRIVLIGTTHPGNIGAAARAMKTMGQNNLYLVRPKIFPSAEATARATGADDILANAQVVDDLQKAISDCDYVVGTTARTRSIPWPTVTPRDFSSYVSKINPRSVAILFGRESSGLSNEEIECCNKLITIPSNPEYSSLNLASAVQIICYELRLNSGMETDFDKEPDKEKRVSQDKMEQFYTHIEKCMSDVGYYDLDNPRKLMHRIRRIFNRTELNEAEYNILRGFFTKIQSKLSNN